MKTIGLLGGMSWESTLIYYQQLNQQINQQLGGLHSAKVTMSSVDFAPLETMMIRGNWSDIENSLIKHSKNLERCGADCLLIATNTMHKLADGISAAISMPLLHIADAVGKDLQKYQKSTVGLLGTQFTMEEAFYKERLLQKFGIETIIPDSKDRLIINEVIFKQLCQGQFLPESKQAYLTIIKKLSQQGAQAIILGCTEIGLLIQQSDTDIPLFDATDSHIKAAVEFALN